MEVQPNEVLSAYKHIDTNDFLYRKHRRQKEEDIAVCVCQYDANDLDSVCGERCLNVLTSTECTHGYCPCGDYCKNQRFQKCQYAKSKLFKTEGRGWGLLADENIKAGRFVIEYCGEVISWKEAKRRSQSYEAAGLQDAYIISLNSYESIDATRKGSLARFINHSCQPNCETRKWTVLGEIRVGIFAKQDIPAGKELAYNYNFEWYGGAKVRCLCGAACCSEFLGAKSRGFQEATYLWEDDDDRYSVEKVPLYDSDDDEPTSKPMETTSQNEMAMVESENKDFLKITNSLQPVLLSQQIPISVVPLNSIPMETDEVKNEELQANNIYSHVKQQNFGLQSATISHIQSYSTFQNYQIESSPISKSMPPYGRSKNQPRKQVNVKLIGERLASKEACEEIFAYEEAKDLADSCLDSLYDEIRPAIEEHERDSQDAVPTSVAEKWISASCCKMKAEFDLYTAIIKNITRGPLTARDAKAPPGESAENGIKYLENGR